MSEFTIKSVSTHDILEKINSLYKDIDSLRGQVNSQAIGLQNVYAEFEKYRVSEIDKKIDALMERLDFHEKLKNVEQLDIEVKRWPFQIKVNLVVKTNFGSNSRSYSYHPLSERVLANEINAQYIGMLKELHETHEARGGKYVGEDGFGDFIREHGETVIDNK